MAQRDGEDRQQQQGSTGQRSEGQGGGHRQEELPGAHGGQPGGKAGPDDADQRRQEGNERQPGAGERSGGEQQQQQGAREDGTDGDEQGRGARVTQGNLGTTQREWSNRDNAAESDEE
jgi:hypothetical protein